jgi:hypothetical protein
MLEEVMMGDKRIAAAIVRLEGALARVEAAAMGAPDHGRVDAEAAGSLSFRHQTLRSKVEGAIARIDALIESEHN